MINCTLCDLPLGNKPFSAAVFYNDGTEEKLKNTIVPESEMRAVVIYSHDGCKTLKESKRKRYTFKKPNKKYYVRHPFESEVAAEKYVDNHFKIIKNENKFLMVLPKFK